MSRKILLTALVVVALLVMLAGALAMASLGPVLAFIALVAMAANGLAAGDALGDIWGFEGQVDDGE